MPRGGVAASRRERVEQAFRRVLRERMAGMPLLNPALDVEVIGPRRVAGAEIGVIITPWAMNLLCFPDAGVLAEGQSGSRRLPVGVVDLTGARDAELGAYEMASLFSPMFGFSDQAVARAVAFEALRTIMRGADVEVEPRNTLPLPAPGPLRSASRQLHRELDRRAVLRGRFLDEPPDAS